MVVKRQKSNADINGQDLVITGGSKGAHGALMQTVSFVSQSVTFDFQIVC